MSKKILLIALLALNSIVLVGQLWPEGVPPFARYVNIAFLSMSFLFFLVSIAKRK
jgi:hypothetical protein